MKRMKVAVVFGGQSSEYEISLISAASVLDVIDRDKYEVITIGITRTGEWLLYNGGIDRIRSDRWNRPGRVKPAFLTPSTGIKGIVVINEDMTYTAIEIDVVFPVLHGKNGEDGTIQGLLELSGLPYVGCGTLSSAVCMDKGVAHDILDRAGIVTAKWLTLGPGDTDDMNRVEEKVSQAFDYPVFVKPANAGSSVGVSKVTDRTQLVEAVKSACIHDSRVVVEEAVVGKEIECAVMGNSNPEASGLGEIVPEAVFYDYRAKYQDDSTELYIPARVDSGIREKVREIAVKAYRAMGCAGLARIDFFVCADGSVVLNELNTMPGFTPISMFPKLFEAAGKTYPQIVDQLLCLAVERKEKHGQ